LTFLVRRKSIAARGFVLAGLVLALTIGGVSAGPAFADPSQTGLITVGPATQSHATGTPQTYNIAVACQGAGNSACGPNSTVTIPLDTSTTPSMTDVLAGGWTYSATSGSAGLLLAQPTVVGNNLVFTLSDAVFASGFSGTIRLLATPPGNVTPNNTSWSIVPTLSGDNLAAAVVAPDPAASIATAAPQPSVVKTTSDGGSVYEAGGPITYNIKATCTTASAGNLAMTSASLVDQLPPGVVYTSSTPAGVYDGGTNTVTWTFGDDTTIPQGCASTPTGGTNLYTVTVNAPAIAPPSVDQPLVNTATFSGVGPDATNPAGVTGTTNDTVPVQIVDTPPTGTGPGYATVDKTSLAPIAQPGAGNQYIGTYSGNWLPTSAAPTYTVGAAAGSFQSTITYGLLGHYETHVVDPLPCLDNNAGNVYSSAPYTGAACANPAFHTTIFQVSSAGFDSPTNGLGAALASGWRPLAILSDGTSVPLTPTAAIGIGASAAYFSIPTVDVGRVSSIDLPGDATLENKTIQLTIWGYADDSLGALNGGINQLTNTVTAVPSLAGTDLTPVQHSASIFTLPQEPQLGISKSFGAKGAGPNGTTIVNITGSVNFPQPSLTHDVVLTDFLPLGLTWPTPVTSANFALKPGSGATATTVTGAVQYLANYEGSGRDLIRMTIPAASFTGAGAWTITPQANLIGVTTPTALGIYTNTDQIFLAGLGTSHINTSCASPTQTGGGTSPATFQSDNSLNLAGDGILSEEYCQNSAAIQVLGTGAAFSLTKTVQGDLDTVAKGALGVGNATEGGSGTYVLKWTNVGSDHLHSAVVYDILPYVGDTGVSGGQSATQRGSQFTTNFTGVGAMPAGVTVEYSQSTNPCRNQVFADSVNTSCVDDWSFTEPTDPSTVKALRFVSPATYVVGDGFSVSINVALPAGVINKIAWNSAATNAADQTDPGDVPQPAEPPKVGIVASNTPVIASQTSSATSHPRVGLTDDVTVAGTGGQPGVVTWSLIGPIAPVAGSCAAVSWAGAATVASGTTATTGDATVTTGPATPTTAGCYSWIDSLSSATAGAFPSPVVAVAGASNEVTRVELYSPSIATAATMTTATDGSRTFADTITIADSGIAVDPGSPASDDLEWTLVGPVAPTGGLCSLVSWAAAPQVATGTLTVTGDAVYTTPATAISAPGCYTFFESLAATSDSDPAATLPGVVVETTLIPAAIIDPTTVAFTGVDPTIPGWIAVILVGLGMGFVGVGRIRRRFRRV
jgi:hypothetical protein